MTIVSYIATAHDDIFMVVKKQKLNTKISI